MLVPSSDLAELLMGDQRVLLRQLCLVELLIVERATMLLSIPVLPAEDVIALAVEAKEAHLLLAFPA
jgi:hypothetical protein